MSILTLYDITLYQPLLLKRLLDTVIHGSSITCIYADSDKSSVGIVNLCYNYSKPNGFRDVPVLEFFEDSTFIVHNRISEKIYHICSQWAKQVKSSRDRHIQRCELIKQELMHYVWSPESCQVRLSLKQQKDI